MNMIKQIFTIILNQYKSNLWILAELFFVSMCLWYIVDYMGTLWIMENKPLGFDIKHTYQIDLSERIAGNDNYITPEDKSTSTGEDLLTVVERLRQYPAIEEVSLSIAAQPYASTAYNTIYHKQLQYNNNSVSAQEYRVTPSFFDVFKTEAMGGNTQDLKQILDSHSILLSSNAADILVNEDLAIGKNIIIGNDSTEKKITGLYVPVRWTEYFNPRPSFYTLLSEKEIAEAINPNNLSRIELCIRVKENMDHNFVDNFIKDMNQQLYVANIYMMDIRPISFTRYSAIGPEQSTILMRSILLGFLLVNIFLGVSGVFGLRTQQRQSELGLRIAVGSSKAQLRTMVFLEGLSLLTLVMIPVIILAFNFGLFELVNTHWVAFTPTRFITGILFTYIIMAFIIMSGIWYPARRTILINPAESLRNE